MFTPPSPDLQPSCTNCGQTIEITLDGPGFGFAALDADAGNGLYFEVIAGGCRITALRVIPQIVDGRDDIPDEMRGMAACGGTVVEFADLHAALTEYETALN